MNAELVVYWMGRFVCQMIQQVKRERPDTTREEVALFILDRWGFPIVPWVGHAWRVSLCKKQDHGIAMFSVVAAGKAKRSIQSSIST